MTFRGEIEAAQARADALETRLREVARDKDRLERQLAERPARATSRSWRRPGLWLGTTGALLLAARQTIEGALREVLARVPADRPERDRPEIATSTVEAAGGDLLRLGLSLDTLTIGRIEWV